MQLKLLFSAVMLSFVSVSCSSGKGELVAPDATGLAGSAGPTGAAGATGANESPEATGDSGPAGTSGASGATGGLTWVAATSSTRALPNHGYTISSSGVITLAMPGRIQVGDQIGVVVESGEVHLSAAASWQRFHFAPNTFEPPLNAQTPVPNTGSGGAWGPVAVDATGTNLIATRPGVDFWTSNDGGLHWTAHATVGASGTSAALNWTGASVSADGATMAVACPGGVYNSTTSGATWFKLNSFGTATQTGPFSGTELPWSAIASSRMGEHRVAVAFAGDIWTSTAGNVSLDGAWKNQTANTAAHGLSWTSVTSDDSGQHLAAAETNGVWTSNDYGETWVKTSVDTWNGFGVLTTVASDASGKILVTGAYGGSLFTSKDYGATWTNVSPSGDTQDWRAFALSKDGTLGIGATDNGLFMLSDAPATSSLVLTGAKGATLTVTYLGSGAFQIVVSTGEWTESAQ